MYRPQVAEGFGRVGLSTPISRAESQPPAAGHTTLTFAPLEPPTHPIDEIKNDVG